VAVLQVDQEVLLLPKLSKLKRLLTLKNLQVREDQVTEVNRINPDQERNVLHGLIVSLILQRSTHTLVLRVTFVETQFHMRELKQYGVSLKEVLQENSGTTVIQSSLGKQWKLK